MAKLPAFSVEQAERLGLLALTFLAEDSERLGRFLALTGTTPDDLRTRAGQPLLLAAVLGHLLEDEPLLMIFSSENSIDPAVVAPAHSLLIQAAELPE